MMTLLLAAAAAAAQPAAPAPANPHAGHVQAAEHKAMDCCKDCCKDMAKKHDDGAEHSDHRAN